MRDAKEEEWAAARVAFKTEVLHSEERRMRESAGSGVAREEFSVLER